MIESIVTAIGTVGYPIVCSLICMYYIAKKDKDWQNTVNKLSSSISGNTAVINRLIDELDAKEVITDESKSS